MRSAHKWGIMFGIIVEVVKSIFSNAIESYAEDAKSVAVNATRDTVESIITGRRTLEEWAEISIKGVDKIKDRVVKEGELRYIGGKLNFAISVKNTNKVVISFELYFLDGNNKWQKIGADSDLLASNFTVEAIDEIKTHGVISYEVE